MSDDAMKALLEQFSRPSADYRSMPFWAWNDRLQEEELIRQIRGMHDQGMGGFFMHSRDGLETPYLGEEWMEAVRACVEEAGRLGMKAWLYDEDRWPSGSAGGTIPAMGDEYRSKGLTLEVRFDDCGYEEDGLITAVFIAEVAERGLRSCRRLQSGEEPRLVSGQCLLVFRVEVSAPSDWFNGQSPPDSMNPDTVRNFIQSTYERYKEALGGNFPEAVAGIFTDEPGVHDRNSKYTPGRGWVPWTYSLPDYFRAQRGYDILDVLPYLFYDGADSPMVRHDYWRTVAEKFCQAYSRQLGEWCEANGIAFTGHYLWENALGVATRVGGAVMPHYRYQQVPGIDLLGEQTDEYTTVKQCTSVANQYGRPFVISETYGCTGWEFTFEGQKWVGDWQYVLGVNLRSQHMALYSLKGCRKRDYPPVFHYQTPWWKYNGIVEDYFARLGAALTPGRAVREVLVLHPASTVWSMMGTSPWENKRRGLDPDIQLADRYGYEYNELLRRLLGAHYDLDLGDETIMAEQGRVQEDRLHVHLAAYRTVVIPPVRTMLRSTWRLLMDFLEAGGKVLACAPAPTMLEGRPSSEPALLYSHPGVTLAESVEMLPELLETLSERTVSICTEDGAQAHRLLYLLKKAEYGHTLFVVNNDRSQSYEVWLEVQASGQLEEWDPLTGSRTQMAGVAAAGGRLRFKAYFGPAGSRLYVIRSKGTQAEIDPEHVQSTGAGSDLPPGSKSGEWRLLHAFGPDFRFIRTEPNVLTLDRCSYRLGDGQWSAERQVWQSQRELRDTLGMRQVYANGIVQRYKWIEQEHPHNGTPVSLRFVFQAGVVPPGDVWLVAEAARRFTVQLNGQRVKQEPDGWYMDRSFERVLLPRLAPGPNVLELTCDYDLAMELEECYLIGDFAVSPDRQLLQEPEKLGLGDWGRQGYFHYSGSMIYVLDYTHCSRENVEVALRLGEYSAVTVEVRVNGQTAGHIPWRSVEELDLTRALRDGRNTIQIEVMGSPRNMLGPFHKPGSPGETVNWESFHYEGKDFTEEYLTQPYGLIGKPELIERIVPLSTIG